VFSQEEGILARQTDIKHGNMPHRWASPLVTAWSPWFRVITRIYTYENICDRTANIELKSHDVYEVGIGGNVFQMT
jgi:hypothetical protein